MWLAAATAASTTRQIYVNRCRKDGWSRRSFRVALALDYCNSLFYGITEGQMSQWQAVQNAAARLVSVDQRSTCRCPVHVVADC